MLINTILMLRGASNELKDTYIYPRVKVVSQTRDKLICYFNGVIVKHYNCGSNFREKKECMKWELKLKIKITRFKVGSNKVIF